MINIQMVENQKKQFSVYKNEFKRLFDLKSGATHLGLHRHLGVKRITNVLLPLPVDPIQVNKKC
jgi:hypothetical protein